MPRINTIVKVEKKEEKFWWQKEFQYLLNRKILSGGELAYLFAQIKSIVEKENNLIGNKSVGLDVGKLKRVLIDEFRVVTPKNQPLGPDAYNLCERQVNALKDSEDKIIVEVKEK